MSQKHVMDYSALRGRIKAVVGNETTFASKLGMSPASLSAKLNNKVGFTQNEMLQTITLLSSNPDQLDFNDIHKYFFCKLT